MDEKKFEVGKLYAKCGGYNMTYYDFYKCVRVSDKSAWFQELNKKWVDGDGFQGHVICTGEPLDKPLVCARHSKFMGREFEMGELFYEDHLD